jgi:hypothetical protein
MAIDDLMTPGQIAQALDEPVTRIAYVIQKLRLMPRKRCGIIRLFDQCQLRLIRGGLYELRTRVQPDTKYFDPTPSAVPATTLQQAEGARRP